jgi:hypothetical protein
MLSCQLLCSYLQFEWERRKMPALDAELDQKIAALRQEAEAEGAQLSEGEESKLRAAVKNRRKKLFDGIPVIKCKVRLRDALAVIVMCDPRCRCSTQVPMQANGYDCGLFVTKFAEMVLRRQPSSTAADVASKFAALLPADAFSQRDVDEERFAMRARIDR